MDVRHPRRRCLAQTRLAPIVALLLLVAGSALALVNIDFEQPYYIHEGYQVWDFCVVRQGGAYVIFYHAIPLDDPYPNAADHIWRAASPDLVRWSDPIIVLSAGSAPHESEAVWAPDVVYNPASGLWFMAYTGVDEQQNQGICMAWSSNLVNWGRVFGNPQILPGPPLFHYEPSAGWAVCRDPYIYEADGLWHMLATVQTAGVQVQPGALLHATSTNLSVWSEGDVFMVNDGDTPDRVLESSTYIERDGRHHLFFHETGMHGVKHVYSDDPATWTMDNSEWLGVGIAPEVDTFDGGENYVISRLGQFQTHPDSNEVYYVAHFDTLLFPAGSDHPDIHSPHPLARQFATYTGSATWGNPVFGDNPARRGETPVGLEGNGYVGTGEFFQGPLGYGVSAGQLGDEALIDLESHPFVITGRSMSFLIGGTANSDLCYLALVDAEADTIIRSAHAQGNATMELRHWNLIPLMGREAVIRIVDADTAAHLNVDAIIESYQDPPVAVAPVVAVAGLRDLGPRPNPFNPRAELRFSLARDGAFQARIHDLRGRVIWDSGMRAGRAGPNSVMWEGRGQGGKRAPGGVYVYRIEAAGAAVSGKITLLP